MRQLIVCDTVVWFPPPVLTDFSWGLSAPTDKGRSERARCKTVQVDENVRDSRFRKRKKKKKHALRSLAGSFIK